MNDSLLDFKKRMTEELKVKFPSSKVLVRQGTNGHIVAYVDGIKIFDMGRIHEVLGQLPVPKVNRARKD